MQPRVLTLYLDTWYGRGGSISSDRMIFGQGLMGQLGFEEVHIPLELWRDDPRTAKNIIKGHWPYSWVFVVPYDAVIYDLREYIQKDPLVVWMCDDVWRWKNFGRYWSPIADVMATTCPEAAVKYADKACLTNWACRPEWEAYKKGLKSVSAGFRGQLYGQRAAIISEISKLDPISVSLANSDRDQVSEESYFQGVASSMFSLCLTGSSHGTPQMKSRLFEPQLLDSVLVTQSVPGLESYWSPGEDCLVFDSPKSCQEQMHELTLDKDRHARMVKSARGRALAEHTYTRRFEPILKKIGVSAWVK